MTFLSTIHLTHNPPLPTIWVRPILLPNLFIQWLKIFHPFSMVWASVDPFLFFFGCLILVNENVSQETFLKIWDNSGLFFVFVLFSFQYQLQFQQHKWIKRSWCAWDSNWAAQDGRRRQNHGAMASALEETLYAIESTPRHWIAHFTIHFNLMPSPSFTSIKNNLNHSLFISHNIVVGKELSVSNRLANEWNWTIQKWPKDYD